MKCPVCGYKKHTREWLEIPSTWMSDWLWYVATLYPFEIESLDASCSLDTNTSCSNSKLLYLS